MGVNPYTDMSWEEFQEHFGLNAPQSCSATLKGNHVMSGNENPKKVDWRNKRAVTDVRNQGGCGSCWTFSTIGALEAHYLLKYPHDEALFFSEQQLVDCAGAFENYGCRGGLPSQAFEYIKYNGGIELEDTYKYEGKDLECRNDPSRNYVTVTKSVNITSGSEEELQDALANNGPVSIAYQVNKDFRHYSSGVFTSDDCGTTTMDVNHAVLAVGYNEANGELPYYIVKNSWGDQWGMSGYFEILADTNLCALSVCNSYPEDVLKVQPEEFLA